MRPALSLEVQAVLGASISESVWQGCEIAHALSLHHVRFEANGASYACYQTGAMKMEKARPGRWEWEKSGVWWEGREIEWEYCPPITERGE